MDGLDSRGQVVLIGATNRVDAIDGALWRPGRFDREFTFSLTSREARATSSQTGSIAPSFACEPHQHTYSRSMLQREQQQQ